MDSDQSEYKRIADYFHGLAFRPEDPSSMPEGSA